MPVSDKKNVYSCSIKHQCLHHVVNEPCGLAERTFFGENMREHISLFCHKKEFMVGFRKEKGFNSIW